MIAENLYDRAFLYTYTVGFERLRAYIMGDRWHTEGCSLGLTQIPAQTIVTLARRMATVRTMIGVSWSVQRADHGEQPYWMAIALAAMLGQIGLPGGGVGFGYGATGGIGSPHPVANTAIADRCQSGAGVYPDGAVQRYAAESWCHL